MGWTGLLIEVDPYFFLQLIGHNRKSYSLNACLSPHRKIGTVREYTHRHPFNTKTFGTMACILGTTHYIRYRVVQQYIHLQGFSNMASDWPSTLLPASQKQGCNSSCLSTWGLTWGFPIEPRSHLTDTI